MVCHRTLPGLHDLNNIRENHSWRCMPSIKITLFEITPRSQENIPFIWMVKGCKSSGQCNAHTASLSYHTSRDTGPRFLRSQPNDRPILVSFYDKQRALMTYIVSLTNVRVFQLCLRFVLLYRPVSSKLETMHNANIQI